MRQAISLLAVVSALCVGVANAAERSGSQEFGSLNPAAPPETAEFSFVIGEWACTTRGMRPDGSIQEGLPATWTFHYILDGWAIQDEWVQEQADGSVSHGMNIRSFNPRTRKRDNR